MGNKQSTGDGADVGRPAVVGGVVGSLSGLAVVFAYILIVAVPAFSKRFRVENGIFQFGILQMLFFVVIVGLLSFFMTWIASGVLCLECSK